MNRDEIILQNVNKSSLGLEIGPSHAPIAPKRSGFKVHILDHLDRQQLVEKYAAHDLPLENIEEVDFVWHGESYLELTNNPNYYDWIIASHVIEHTPDLIGFLLDCDSILNDAGVLSLAIPDMRYCFDHFRALTGLSQVIDAHLNPSSIHSAGSAAEYFLNVVSKDNEVPWEHNGSDGFQLVHTLEEARHAIKSVVEDNRHLDVHAWCFTPNAFRLVIQDLYDLGYIPFREVAFHETIGHEFFATLGRQGNGLNAPRVETLQTIQRELCGCRTYTQSSPTQQSWLNHAIQRLAERVKSA